MNFIYKILFTFLILTNISFANTLTQTDLNNENISISNGSFKVIAFDKMIKNIKVSDKESLEVDFIDDKNKPLQNIKIFTKKLGHGNILVTFYDGSYKHLDINIVENLESIINLMKLKYPQVQISQLNDTLLLKGIVNNEKEKKEIIQTFEKANIDSEKKLIDLLDVINPDKMVRLKLYVVEIDNNKAELIRNDWSLLNFNDGRTSASASSDMLNAVNISGGITAVANRLGSKFNVGFTLDYLKTKNIAKVLDETTLITLENHQSSFHAGGILRAKVSTTDTSSLEVIEYGLKMNVNVNKIINDKYINLTLNTESSLIDDSVARVDNIPAIKNRTIITNVIVDNLSTIVLGGLVNTSKSEAEEKIPVLGDIPLLGRLFRSTNNEDGNLELVFFITPEIVDPTKNNQSELLSEKTNSIENVNVISSNTKIDKIEEKKTEKTSPSKEELHEQRVREILGY